MQDYNINKANALSRQNQHQEASRLYDKSIAITEKLVNREGRDELASRLALLYRNKADLLTQTGDPDQAQGLVKAGIKILERIVYREKQTELTGDPARIYVTQAMILNTKGNRNDAGAWIRKAVTILRTEIKNSPGRGLEQLLDWAEQEFGEFLKSDS